MNFDKWRYRDTPLVAMKLAEETGEVMDAILNPKPDHGKHIVEELDHVIGIALILRRRFSGVDTEPEL